MEYRNRRQTIYVKNSPTNKVVKLVMKHHPLAKLGRYIMQDKTDQNEDDTPYGDEETK